MQRGFEYDPERALWRPGRRTFLFMLGGALAGTLLPGDEVVGVDLASGPDITVRAAFIDPRKVWRATMREIGGDPSMSRELGLQPFRTTAELQAAGILLLREGDRLQ